MFRATFCAATIRECYCVNLLFTLWKNTRYSRGTSIPGRKFIAQLKLAHGFPARKCFYFCVQRLGFTHGGAGGKDDQIGFLKAGEHAVERRESRRDASQRARVLLQVLKTLPGFRQLFLDGGEFLQHRRVRDREDGLLSFVQDGFDVAVFLKAEFSYF